jgi:hypothetical protein
LNQYSDQVINTLSDGDATSIRMPVPELLENHVAIQRRTVRTAIGRVKGNLKSITLQHIDAVLRFCREGSPGQLICLPDGVTIQKQSEGHVSISRQPSPPISRARSHLVDTIPLYTVPVPHPDDGTRTVIVKELGITLVLGSMPVASISNLTSAGQHTAFFDMDKLTSGR